MELTQKEKKLIMLLRKLEQHQRVEMVKIKEDTFTVKRTTHINLEDLYKDSGMV